MKYLINETSEEERKAIVEKALGISLSGADEPSDKAIALAKDYIEGKKELEDIQKYIVEYYQSKGIDSND